MNNKQHTIWQLSCYLSYIEGISWVLLYCLPYNYLFNIPVYDKM